MKNLFILALVFSIASGGIFVQDAFADTTATNTQIISNGTVAAIGDSDLFGYDVISIGNLDGLGGNDFATINFHDNIVLDRDGDTDPVGSISIIFMNTDGTVSGVKKISIDNSTTVNDGVTGDFAAVIDDFNTGNGIGQNFGGATGCLDDPALPGDDTWLREGKAIEEAAYLGVRNIAGGVAGDHAVLALGANAYDFNGEDSGGVILIEIDTDGTVLSCAILAESADITFTNPGIGRGNDWSYFGWPILSSDVDGDGTLDLIVGQDDDVGGAHAAGLPTNVNYGAEPDYFQKWYDDRLLGIVRDNNTPSTSGVTACAGVYDATCQPEMYVGTTDLVVLLLNPDGSVKGNELIDAGAFGMDGSIKWLETGSTIDGNGKITVSGNACGKFQSSSVYVLDLDTDGTLLTSFEFSDEYINANFVDFGLSLDSNTFGGCSSAFGSGLAPLGDLDGDGVEDIFIGNEQNAGNGAYVTYLNSDNTIKEMDKIEAPIGGTNFAHGADFWKVDGDTVSMFIGAHEYPTGSFGGAVLIYELEYSATASPNNGGGGSADGHKTRPTFGLDHNTNRQLVDNGLLINNAAFTVDDNFFTHIPMQNLTVGEVQNFTATTYASKQLKVLEFLFGVPEVGKWGDAEASVALFLNFTGGIEGVEFKNKADTIIDFDILNYSSTKTFCQASDNTQRCDKVSIELVFNESPLGKVLALQAIDYSGRSHILYFNDGLDIEGESLNPPTVKQIFSGIKYKGFQTIQRIDKANDIWMSMDKSEPVLLYQKNSFGTFIPIERRTFESTPDDINDLMTRIHSEFNELQLYEQRRAVILFDSEQIQSVGAPSYELEYSESVGMPRMDKLTEIIESEQLRAIEAFNLKYEGIQ